jgi:hypothetical protein
MESPRWLQLGQVAKGHLPVGLGAVKRGAAQVNELPSGRCLAPVPVGTRV